MRILLLVVVTAFCVWQILRLYGVFEISKGAGQLDEDIKEERKNRRKRAVEQQKLQIFSHFTNFMHNIYMPPSTYEEYRYIIERLEIRSEILDRNLTPEELRGKYIAIMYAGFLFLPLALVNVIYLVPSMLGVAIFVFYPTFYRKKIEDEDLIIDTYFIDLYLLMYSKLKMGSRARLQPVVASYIDTLSVVSNEYMRKVMGKLARTLLNNLSLYEDHTAVQKLREKYKSATMVNFCNVATQAMQGVDNADTLLTFKMDLVRRKLDLSRKKAESLQRKAERAIFLIYIILFIFIVVGWYSKLPTGFF